jgi:hypothetical protein
MRQGEQDKNKEAEKQKTNLRGAEGGNKADFKVRIRRRIPEQRDESDERSAKRRITYEGLQEQSEYKREKRGE